MEKNSCGIASCSTYVKYRSYQIWPEMNRMTQKKTFWKKKKTESILIYDYIKKSVFGQLSHNNISCPLRALLSLKGKKISLYEKSFRGHETLYFLFIRGCPQWKKYNQPFHDDSSRIIVGLHQPPPPICPNRTTFREFWTQIWLF